MSTRYTGLSFATVLILTGCANGVNIGPITLPASGTTSEHASADVSVDRQESLYLNIVDGLVKQNRQAAALAFLDSYRQTGETLSPRYWLLRGNALSSVHRDGEAIEAFAELRRTSLAPQGWNGQGRIAAHSGDWTKAETCFSKAVEGDPANADFLNNLAFAELHLDKPGEAAGWLQQAHELEPASDRILTNLAIAWSIKGDSARADTIIAGIKDGGRRDAMRAVVKSAAATLTTKGKS